MQRTTGDEVTLELEVTSRAHGAHGVVVLTLQKPDRSPLPEWEPGAHIDLRLSSDLIRQYSLCGPPDDRTRWRIAVLREPDGRGGSRAVHEQLPEGSTVEVHGPRNNFVLESAPAYVFIAGGIGITPILPMVAAAQRSGADVELHYGGRSRSSMAFLDELERQTGVSITLHPQDEIGLIDLPTILDQPRPAALVYACGPEPLLAAVEQQCAEWPSGTLHTERFSPKDPPPPTRTDTFEVELSASGITLTVPPEESILEAAELAGIPVLYSCREGTCGTCETTVLEGEVEHRDSLLSPDEQAAHDVMFICVSRAACPKLVLDL